MSDRSIRTRYRAKERAIIASRAMTRRQLAAATKWLASARRRNAHPREWLTRRVAKLHRSEDRQTLDLIHTRKIIRTHTPLPLRERAYAAASALLKQGVFEEGGNNRGPEVEKIIREGGGLAGQAWCGWFMAAAYKRAGSTAVNGNWGAVRLMLQPGVRRTSQPRRGDIVRFTFDHTGMFVRKLPDGRIETIEGNTGRVGAVSDSRFGGDGVYRKIRDPSLVRDYLRVTR